MNVNEGLKFKFNLVDSLLSHFYADSLLIVWSLFTKSGGLHNNKKCREFDFEAELYIYLNFGKKINK